MSMLTDKPLWVAGSGARVISARNTQSSHGVTHEILLPSRRVLLTMYQNRYIPTNDMKLMKLLLLIQLAVVALSFQQHITSTDNDATVKYQLHLNDWQRLSLKQQLMVPLSRLPGTWSQSEIPNSLSGVGRCSTSGWPHVHSQSPRI